MHEVAHNRIRARVLGTLTIEVQIEEDRNSKYDLRTHGISCSSDLSKGQNGLHRTHTGFDMTKRSRSESQYNDVAAVNTEAHLHKSLTAVRYRWKTVGFP